MVVIQISKRDLSGHDLLNYAAVRIDIAIGLMLYESATLFKLISSNL